jgi:ABC-type bacteriocin/lantibiotic exporter with double-glycine peptidase domain
MFRDKSWTIVVFLYIVVSGAVVDAGDFRSGGLVEKNRCGAYALQVCAQLNGMNATLADLERVLPPNGEEISLLQLREAAKKLGLHAVAIHRDKLPSLISAPAIIPTIQVDGLRHFVVLAALSEKGLLIVDVPQPPYWVSTETFRKAYKWNGYALHIAKNQVDLIPLYSRLLGLQLLCGAGGVLAIIIVSRRWRARS